MPMLDYTLVITTKDRPHWVRITFSYYVKVGFPYPILLVDSSDEVEETKAIVSEVNLNISYYHFPNTFGTEAQCKVLEEISTPYCSFLGDDDFLLWKNVAKYTSFLDEHRDFSFATGFNISPVVDLSKSGEERIFQLFHHGINEARGKSILDETPEKRLLEWSESPLGLNTFAVMRTSTYRMIYKKVADWEFDKVREALWVEEITLNQLLAIEGKGKRFEEPQFIMCRHSMLQHGVEGLDFFKLLHSAVYNEVILKSTACIAGALSLKAGIPLNEAQKISEAACLLWDVQRRISYIGINTAKLGFKTSFAIGSGVIARIRRFIFYVKGLKDPYDAKNMRNKIWSRFKSKLFKKNIRSVTEALKDKTGYYKEFQEVYWHIINAK
jgi:glycosyltransferase domain-containing protein